MRSSKAPAWLKQRLPALFSAHLSYYVSYRMTAYQIFPTKHERHTFLLAVRLLQIILLKAPKTKQAVLRLQKKFVRLKAGGSYPAPAQDNLFALSSILYRYDRVTDVFIRSRMSCVRLGLFLVPFHIVFYSIPMYTVGYHKS